MTSATSLHFFFEVTRDFSKEFSSSTHNQLRGITDGKAVGTYIEHRFQDYLIQKGVIRNQDIGNSARGIDLPTLDIDIKVTSIRQPQSSSPFKSYMQKIEGLGYNLILFVYEKRDTLTECYLPLRAVRFIPKERTADYQTTMGILGIIARNGNADDIFAFLIERMIPVDELTLAVYAERLLREPPLQGYLTISNALQWRLQYGRVIGAMLPGIVSLDPIPEPPLPATLTDILATEDEASRTEE